MSRKRDAVLKAALRKLVEEQQGTKDDPAGTEGAAEGGQEATEKGSKKRGRGRKKAEAPEEYEEGEDGEKAKAKVSKRQRRGKKADAAAGGDDDDGGGGGGKAQGGDEGEVEEGKGKGGDTGGKGKGRKAQKDAGKASKAAAIESPSPPPRDTVKAEVDKCPEVWINRAPVLTMWVAVVALRRGRDWQTALTYGKYIAGVFAHSKGVSIGVYEKKERKETAEEREAARGEHTHDHVLGRKLHVKSTPEGLRAMDSDNNPIDPRSVATYLHRAFKEQYDTALHALMSLAWAYKDPEALDSAAYDLYTHFRPSVSHGQGGWGQRSRLDLQQILRMADEAQAAVGS